MGVACDHVILSDDVIIHRTSTDMIQSLDKEESSLQAHMTVIKLHCEWCLWY